MSTKNLIASQRGTDDARADLGLSGDHVETLRALLDSLTSLKDESALAQGAPSIEIGSD